MITKFILCVLVCAIVNVGFMEWQYDFIKAKFKKKDGNGIELPSWVLSIETMLLACLGGFLSWKYIILGTPFFVAVLSFCNLAVQQIGYQTIIQAIPETIKACFSKISNAKD